MGIEVEPLSGLRLEVDPQPELDPYLEREVSVSLDVPGLSASATLPWYLVDPPGVAAFFRDIDRHWTGWEGEKRFGTVEDTLCLSASHDGLGHIRLWIRFANGWPGDADFKIGAALAFDVGSAAAAAQAIENWVSDVWPG